MATTENFVFGDGGDTYSFSFPYLKTEDVRVELQEYDSTQPAGDRIISRSSISAFTIPAGNPTQIIFNAIGADTVYQTAPDGDVKVTSTNGYPVRIRIYRATQPDATPATFFAGSAIRAQDLNDNFDQILYIMQEKENALISIQTGGIGDNVISTSAIQDDAVDATKLRDSVSVDGNRAVTTNHIRDNAVTTDKIAANAVTAAKLADNSVDTAAIVDANVTTDKIANLNVTTDKINDSAVTSAKINNSAVTTAKINDSAVTTAKIVGGAVTEAELATDAVTTTKVADGAVTSAKIANATIVTDNLADSAVTSAKIASGTIVDANVNASAAIADSKLTGTTCKAWVNFNGTLVTNPGSTTGIRASYNVSSVTDNGTGDYRVNFASSFADSNYSAQATINTLNDRNVYVTDTQVDSCDIDVVNPNGVRIDSSSVNVAIFR